MLLSSSSPSFSLVVLFLFFVFSFSDPLLLLLLSSSCPPVVALKHDNVRACATISSEALASQLQKAACTHVLSLFFLQGSLVGKERLATVSGRRALSGCPPFPLAAIFSVLTSSCSSIAFLLSFFGCSLAAAAGRPFFLFSFCYSFIPGGQGR